MKRLIAVALVAAFLVALPASHLVMAGKGKVAICHFNGHQGVNFGDWVICGDGSFCRAQGGKVIRVGIPACQNGHGADPDGTKPCNKSTCLTGPNPC